MPLVRVYQNPDGSVRILHPNPAAWTGGSGKGGGG